MHYVSLLHWKPLINPYSVSNDHIAPVAKASCEWACWLWPRTVPQALLNSTLTFHLFKLPTVGTELRRIICWHFKAAFVKFWLIAVRAVGIYSALASFAACSCKLLFRYRFFPSKLKSIYCVSTANCLGKQTSTKCRFVCWNCWQLNRWFLIFPCALCVSTCMH